MRQHMYRAWNKDKKVMLQPFSVRKLINGFNTEGNWSSYEEDELMSINYEGSDEYELMEFTGLYDKNNTPIFEGDIVKLEGEDIPNEIKHVVYEDASFDLFPYHISGDNTLVWASNYEDGNLLEVIGNIYQDSHLLEVEK